MAVSCFENCTWTSFASHLGCLSEDPFKTRQLFGLYTIAEKDPLGRIYLALCRTFRQHFRARPFAAINGPKSLFQNGKMNNFSKVSKRSLNWYARHLELRNQSIRLRFSFVLFTRLPFVLWRTGSKIESASSNSLFLTRLIVYKMIFNDSRSV